MMALPPYVPQEDLAAISEEAANRAFEGMQYAQLRDLPEAVARGPVDVSYLATAPPADASAPPLLLVHGFDISSLEYRRLLPRLEAAGLEAYAPCIAGWGFTDTSNMRTVGVEGKRAQLLAFHQQVLGGRPAVWVGASLGACIALDCYLARPSAFHSVVSLDPGFFTEAPPAVPAAVGRLLLQNVLSAPGVRRSIAKQAYYDKEGQTDDAIRCGNLHLRRERCARHARVPQHVHVTCARARVRIRSRTPHAVARACRWEEDSLEWLLGGAYGGIGEEVPKLADVPTLTLWGRQVCEISIARSG